MTAQQHLNGQITMTAIKDGRLVKLIYCGYTLEQAKASFKRELQKLWSMDPINDFLEQQEFELLLAFLLMELDIEVDF